MAVKPILVRWLVAWLAAAPLALSAAAAERDQGAHVHGVGKLNIAIEGQVVEMELMMPGADVVGFERAPATPEDKAEVARALSDLKQGDRLFAFPPGAGCRLEQAEVESGLLDDEPAGDGHEREDRHEGVEHAEFHAEYRFRCERPNRVTHIDLGLFERFPAAREIEAQTISARGQGAAALTPSSARLHF